MGGKIGLSIQVNATRCTACKACELACSFAKEQVFAPRLSRIRVVQRETAGLNVPVVCANCANAPCISACPTSAVYRDGPNSAIHVSEEECIGCGACVRACPFGAAEMNEERGVAIICDLCDGEPACVQHCIYGALSLGSPATSAQAKRLTQARVVAAQYEAE